MRQITGKMWFNLKIKNESKETRLATEELAKEIMQEQVLPYFRCDKFHVLKFPRSVWSVSKSFVEGILDNLPDGIKREDFDEYFEVDGRKRVVNKFLNVMMLEKRERG